MALMNCPRINSSRAKSLLEKVGSAVEIFQRRTELPQLDSEIHPDIVRLLDCPEAFKKAEKEMEFIEKNHLTCLTFFDERYPFRLRECVDAPVMLFYKGNADLNRLHVISIVGTRRATDYGKQFCATFLRELAALCPDILVVSGLAYGIDVCAHRGALENGLSTVGVLAHGLDRIYPAAHRKTAVDMLATGGLLTEYFSGTEPERYNFVGRNRIVAGMSDAVIVVESAEKGGSLITAELAGEYNRPCFAVPGRVTDEASRGCNRLIASQGAQLIESAEDFMQAMNWMSVKQKEKEGIQRELFPELSDDEKTIVRVLTGRDGVNVNTLSVESNIPYHSLSATLLELEMKGVVKQLVGGMVRLV